MTWKGALQYLAGNHERLMPKQYRDRTCVCLHGELDHDRSGCVVGEFDFDETTENAVSWCPCTRFENP